MRSSKLLVQIRYLASPTTKYFLQSRCLLHSTEQGIAKAEEQPHMRVEAKAIIEQKRMYCEKEW